MKISYLKSFDDEDYYEFDINKDEYEISNLEFRSNDDNCYEVLFSAKIIIKDDKWNNADENFKKNAESGFIEVEFDLENNGEKIEVKNGKNISNNKGYDNQPSFIDDEKILYASTRNGQTDIAQYQINYKAKIIIMIKKINFFISLLII